MQALRQIDTLAHYQYPYMSANAENEQLFAKAMQEADIWHKNHNKNYAKFWQGDYRPLIPVGIFKQVNLTTSVDDEGVWLTSSGTSKRSATQVFFDKTSLARIEKAMFSLFVANGLFSQQPARFLLLSPDPRKGQYPGYATAFLKFTAAAPVQELVFAVSEAGVFDAAMAIATLQRWAVDEAPIFIFGLTVFFEQLALALDEAIVFKGEIKGITGGGWKGLTKTLERNNILAILHQKLQSNVLDIRDMFGLTEHPLHYLSCPLGHFHEPVYSRFFIIGAGGFTLRTGEQGLIRLQNPFFSSLPAQDILTEDSGYLGENCPCGNPRPYLVYLGRVSSNKGICAQEASL